MLWTFQNKALQSKLLQVCKRLEEHEHAVENFKRSNYCFFVVCQLYSSINFILLFSRVSMMYIRRFCLFIHRWFLPRDAVRSMAILSVRLSVTLMDYVETVKHIVKILTLLLINMLVFS